MSHTTENSNIQNALFKKRMTLYRSGNLQKDIFLVYLTSNDNENLVGLVNFDFRILWRNMKTKNIGGEGGSPYSLL